MSLMTTNSRAQHWEGDCTLSVSTTNLSVGPHWLEVRMQGDNGVWCAWQGQWFRVAGERHLVGAEWFVDADPGAGKGNAISAPADGAWDETEENLTVTGVSAADLSVGHHTLFVRCQDSDGNWGLTNHTVFYVSEPLRIVEAEWTADPRCWTDDTNVVKGVSYPMVIKPDPTNTNEVTLQATGTADQLGSVCSTPSIYIRVKDSLGRWSTRHGLHWVGKAGEPGGEWVFDPVRGWATAVIPDIPIPPAMAADPDPADGSFWPTPPTALQWKPCPGADSYEVAFWRQGKPPTKFTLKDNSVPLPAPLALASAYFWKVRSISANGCYIDSPADGLAEPSVWHFLVQGPGDANGDGMPDLWETQYFGSPGNADVASDHDGDGVPDWQEYVAGTNPTNKLDYFRVESVEMLLPPTGLTLSWPTAQGRQYTVFTTDKFETPCEAGREPGRMYPICSNAAVTTWTKVYETLGNGAMQSYINIMPGLKGRFFKVGVGLTGDP
jgi:hypothetical protein